MLSSRHMFWKKKSPPSGIVVKCPVCFWEPDGGSHWKCSCGNVWNTFDTKALCKKCGTQWQDTWCPACGKASPHSDWYKTPSEWEAVEQKLDPRLLAKKKTLEAKLISYGITRYRISHLPYLEPQNETLQSAYETGCRMMILHAMAEAANDLTLRPEIIAWLQEEKIWEHVSPAEKKFLEEPSPEEQVCIEMSWRAEGALVLSWCLNCIEELPALDSDDNSVIFQDFFNNVPHLGESLMVFLTKLEFRNMEEIYEENLLNELATSYFRDLIFSGKQDTTRINRSVSFERHSALNWLRQFGIEEMPPGEAWDEVDTST